MDAEYTAYLLHDHVFSICHQCQGYVFLKTNKNAAFPVYTNVKNSPLRIVRRKRKFRTFYHVLNFVAPLFDVYTFVVLQYWWRNPEGYRSINTYHVTTKRRRCRSMCVILEIYYMYLLHWHKHFHNVKACYCLGLNLQLFNIAYDHKL